MKQLSTALICVGLVLTQIIFCATVQDPLRLIQLLQMTEVTAQTYWIVEKRLETLNDYVRTHRATDIDKKLNQKPGWTRSFIQEIENDLQRIKPSTKQEKKEQAEPLSLQNRDVQDLLIAKKAINALMSQKLTDDNRKEIEGQLIFLENAASRLEKRNQLQEATAFLDLEPGNTLENYTKEIRSTLAVQPTAQPESILEKLKKLDTQFSKIILHTKNDIITAEQLIAAKHALDAFRELRAQLTEQERKEVQKKVLGDLAIDFYIGGMEKAYETRLKFIPDAVLDAFEKLKKEEEEKAMPDALSLASEELKKEEEEKVKKELARPHAEKTTQKRETSVRGEFRLSYKEKPTQFTNYPKFGRAFLFEVPTLAFYSDPYVPLERAALIEYNWNNSMRKIMPQALAKVLPERMSPAPAVYGIIWLNFTPKAHYNFVAHPVITGWLHPELRTEEHPQLMTSTGAITDIGKKYLFFNTQATMGLFPISGIERSKGATLPVDTIGAVAVNPHSEQEADVIRFSPDNAYFFIDPKAQSASFWTYLAWGDNKIIMYNIVINTFNTGAPVMSAGQIENLIERSYSLEQLIKRLSGASTLFKKDDAIHQELQVFQTLAELE